MTVVAKQQYKSFIIIAVVSKFTSIISSFKLLFLRLNNILVCIFVCNSDLKQNLWNWLQQHMTHFDKQLCIKCSLSFYFILYTFFIKSVFLLIFGLQQNMLSDKGGGVSCFRIFGWQGGYEQPLVEKLVFTNYGSKQCCQTGNCSLYKLPHGSWLSKRSNPRHRKH